MNITMGTGDKKKVVILSVLMLGALYGVYSNLTDNSTPAARPRKTVTTPGESDLAPAPTAATQPSGPDLHRAATSNKPRENQEFRPALHKKGETVDPVNMDPTLRTDLLAKVQAVKPEEAQRNIFQFGPAQPPPATTLAKTEPIVKPHPAFVFPKPLPEKKDPEPVTKVEPEPPVPYKYYGLSSTKLDGKKTAFFLDGEEIILATEGMVVKKRYKVVKIGTTSVVMENVDNKKQQTVNYTEDAPNVSSGG